MSDIETSKTQIQSTHLTKRSFLELFDLFAAPVALTYNGWKSHPTKCGGFLSILYSFLLGMFLLSRLWIWLGMNGDEYSQSRVHYDEEENYAPLLLTDISDNKNESAFNFHVYFVDNNKTNWDERYNAFYTFKLHRYTNIRDYDLS